MLFLSGPFATQSNEKIRAGIMTVPVLINAPEQSVSDVVVGYYTIFTQSSGAKIERLTGQPCLLSVNNSSGWGTLAGS